MNKTESATYVGCGFAVDHANGFLAKFDDWITRSTASGGANWYVIEDGSTAVSRTYVPTTDIDSVNDTITINGHGFFTGQKVITNAANSTFSGGIANIKLYFIRSVNINTIKIYYSFFDSLNDTNTVNLNTAGATATPVDIQSCPYKVYCNTTTPVLNDNTVKFIVVWSSHKRITGLANSDYLSNVIRFHPCLWWDTTNHIPRGIWGGVGVQLGSYVTSPNTVTGTYYFVGNPDFFMVATSYITVALHHFLLDDWTYNPAGYEAPSKIGTLSAPATSGRRVTLTLGSGEAANFTVGKYYFIYDFNGHTQVEYVKLISRNTGNDTIIVDPLTYSYPSGTKIGSYPHRFCFNGTGISTNTIEVQHNWYSGFQVPYNSSYDRTSNAVSTNKIFYDQKDTSTNLISSELCATSDVLRTIKEKDGVTFYVERPLLSEYRDYAGTTQTNGYSKIIGTCNHMYLCNAEVTLIPYVDFINIGGIKYISLGTTSVTNALGSLFNDALTNLLIQVEDS